jgi:hypothetical protein
MIKLDPSELVYWFNALRDLPENERTRALDAFWAGQIDSKVWLIEELNKLHSESSDVYIFGGWIGVLASMMFQASTFPINKMRSIDLDPWCESVADMMCKPHEMNQWKFKAITADMSEYQYESNPTLVINTSTEHVTQDSYDIWYNLIPTGTLVVAQGNDFFDCIEHIRCTDNLEDFKKVNRVSNPLFSGALETYMYQRFMCIWRKE